MVDIWLPYGKTEVCVRVQAKNLLGSIEPIDKPGVPDVKAEIKKSLMEPIGSKRLAEIVKPGDKVTITVDNRISTYNHILISSILDELNGAGIKNENMTVIMAGNTDACGDRDASISLGDIAEHVKVVSHDMRTNDLVYLGNTSKHGTKVYVNRLFAEADVKILVGDINLHSFAGYRGGRYAVLPGIAGEETIRNNHAMLIHPNARSGMLEGNPVHEDMTEAARLAKVDFILNIVTDVRGNIVKSFSGDLEKAFYNGVKLMDEMCRVPVDRKADIVVVSPGGYPYDLNLYGALDCLENIIEVVKRGGVVVLVAECMEGYGNQIFYEWMIRFKDLKAVEGAIKRGFVLGGHKAFHLLRALQKVQIILVSAIPDYYAVNVFKLKTARTVNGALNEALKIAGENAKVWVMPYGGFIMPELKAA